MNRATWAVRIQRAADELRLGRGRRRRGDYEMHLARAAWPPTRTDYEPVAPAPAQPLAARPLTRVVDALLSQGVDDPRCAATTARP